MTSPCGWTNPIWSYLYGSETGLWRCPWARDWDLGHQCVISLSNQPCALRLTHLGHSVGPTDFIFTNTDPWWRTPCRPRRFDPRLWTANLARASHSAENTGRLVARLAASLIGLRCMGNLQWSFGRYRNRHVPAVDTTRHDAAGRGRPTSSASPRPTDHAGPRMGNLSPPTPTRGLD